MAGVSVDAGGSRRKAVDSEVNMIPMIDLLMVTVSFLLITAVWSHMERLNASAQVPGSESTAPPCAEGGCNEPQLDVDIAPTDRFVLRWRQGHTVLRTVDVPRTAADTAKRDGSSAIRYPALARAIANEWHATGAHKDASDLRRDRAVLHVGHQARFEEIVAAMDAIYQVHRPMRGAADPGGASAFAVTMAAD